MFRYLFVDHALPAMFGLAELRISHLIEISLGRPCRAGDAA
jgi:hypothetical protein